MYPILHMARERELTDSQLEKMLRKYERNRLAISTVFDSKTPLRRSDEAVTILGGLRKGESTLLTAADLPFGKGLEVRDPEVKDPSVIRQTSIIIRPTESGNAEVEVRVRGRQPAKVTVGKEPVFITSSNMRTQEEVTVRRNYALKRRGIFALRGTKIAVPGGLEAIEPLGIQVEGDRVRVQNIGTILRQVTQLG